LTLVSYHVRELVRLKFLVLRRTEPVRGVVKNYYVPNDEALEISGVKELLAPTRPESS